jgi:putative hydrolase of the HAD superfamily
MKTREQYLAMIRQVCKPMEPVPTGVTAELKTLRNVDVILLDVYGTLLISSSGEVGTGDTALHDAAFCKAIQEAGLILQMDGTTGCQALRQTIAASHQRSRESGIDYPEVDITEVWRKTLEELKCQGLIQGSLADVDVPSLSLHYELLTNPVWPMPRAAECMMELANRNIRLGLVSNAQWFTPLLFPALLGGELDAIGIGAEMQFWSWQRGVAKPSESLFRYAAQTLSDKGIQPDRVLHIGNDMLNDVRPAAKVGFRTALFAGDQRSLRLRSGDQRVADVTADLVILHLVDLLNCIRPQTIG